MMKQKKAVVLLSGGMDSAVCAAIARDEGYMVAALHLNYGQKTEAKELECYENLCKHYEIEDKLVVDVSHLGLIGGSSLTDSSIEVSDADLEAEEIPSSYVPFRNGNILSIAASWAEVIEAEALFIGAMQLDSSGYPDCREEFFDAFEKAINLGNKPETTIRIKTPLIDMTKKDIVEIGTQLDIPFKHTWSCYGSQEKACGKCDSCALRLRGFSRAGTDDPLLYEIKPIYR
jgi:7-cyano-7-deazaguanine synthase